MRVIRSVLFYVMLIVSTFFVGIAAMLVYFATHRREWAHLCARFWGKINLWAAGVTVYVAGVENIQPERAYIFAANHQSWFDIFAVLAKLPTQFRWLAKHELFRIPILGQAMTATGYIPIDRSDRRKAFESLRQAAMQAKRGTSIVIFPEGTRSPDGVLQEFKKGGFILALESQQPMVPISISGSHRILPKRGEWLIQPGIIDITICKPIPTADFTMADRNTLMSLVRQAMRENLTESEGGLQPDHAKDIHRVYSHD